MKDFKVNFVTEQEQETMRVWIMSEEPPACQQGLELLLKFAQASPTLYALAERVNFNDPAHPGFKRNPLWMAFCQHYSNCDNCNEA
ncbi:hypothetical protein HDF16_005328 [Granulicella aggregans]|uniref:Uncharacterized protein n=1 Tax=Granulicella aggregans TaxID=474949 RepID=A0A7W7ZIL9_9BACT|nr:hypothetical protein [Granulicella aggregans]MBB5060592.1 hypothetical protein [Granulicella aggregans]